MREILFRGKRADTGEWIYGDLRQDADLESAYIGGWDYFTADYALQREPFEYPVSPETVSQFTGLTDRNGEKIFEGDIIAYRKGCLAVSFDFASFGFLFEGYNGEEGYSHVIPFNDYENGIYIDRKTYQIDYEIVGNVLDNSDLLKGE